MRNTPERRAFDLATDHLVVEKRWIAPDLRKSAPDFKTPSINPDAVRAKQLEYGVELMSKMLEYLSHHTDDEDLGTSTLAPAGLNSAWYSYARGSEEVGRRILELPYHAGDGEHITAEQLLKQAASIAELALVDASFAALQERNYNRDSERGTVRMRLGQKLGYGALTLASAPEAVRIGSIESLEHRQEIAWQAGRTALRGALELRDEIGFDPTVDQLASPYSPLVAHLNNSPELGNTLDALIYATDMTQVAA